MLSEGQPPLGKFDYQEELVDYPDCHQSGYKNKNCCHCVEILSAAHY